MGHDHRHPHVAKTHQRRAGRYAKPDPAEEDDLTAKALARKNRDEQTTGWINMIRKMGTGK